MSFWKDWVPAERSLNSVVEAPGDDECFTLICQRDHVEDVDVESFLSWVDLIGQR